MTLENCKYCTGKDRDRENLIDDKYIDLYVTEDNTLTVWMEFSSPGLKINIETPIEHCPKCGRKL